jgi:YD repeat-containing protein
VSVAQDSTHSLVTRFAYNRLGALTETRSAAVENFKAIPEGVSAPLPEEADTVLRLYALLTGIAPDRSTLDAMAATIAAAGGEDNNNAVSTAAAAIIAANPQSFPPSMTDREFLIYLYQTGLNRTPSEAEIASWINGGQPSTPAPGSTVVAQLYTVLFGNVSNLDRTTLDRLAPQTGSPEAEVLLASQLINNTPTLINLSDRHYIIHLYQNALSRIPREDEIAGWVNYLATPGITRAIVAYDFSHVSGTGTADSITFNNKVNKLLDVLTATAPLQRALVAVGFTRVTNSDNQDSRTLRDKTTQISLPLTPPIGSGGRIDLISTGIQELVERYSYDELGRRIKTVNAAGEITRNQYDLAGNLIRTRDAFDAESFSYYDNQGHKTAEIDANGRSRSDIYNDKGQLAQSTDLGGKVTNYTYNSAGQLTAQDGIAPVRKAQGTILMMLPGDLPAPREATPCLLTNGCTTQQTRALLKSCMATVNCISSSPTRTGLKRW